MPVRVSATDRIRTKIDALFAEDRELPEILEEVARLGAQLLMQAALEAEVTEFIGRERYQRTAACPEANGGSRNGYRPVTVKTTTGPVTLERPKLRGTTEVFASRLFGKHVTKTNALETLVIASFVRGLSVRDVQATLAEVLGDQAAISKSTVSEVGGARPRLGRLARPHHDTGRHPTAARPTPITPRPTSQTAAALHHEWRHRPGRSHLRHRVETSRRDANRLSKGSPCGRW